MSVPERYYTPTGVEINRSKLVQDMITNYKNTVGGLADFTEGTEVRNLLESINLTLFKLEFYTNLNLRESFVVYANGGYLDLHGLERNITRKPGLQSAGFVTVNIPEAVATDTVISEDLVFFNPETNLEYAVYLPLNQLGMDYEYKILAGDTSVTIPVFCTTVGSIGDCERLKVTGFTETPTVTGLTVYNNEAITGGTDSETDEDYRSRILANESNNSFGSKNWYINLLNQVDGVHDSVVEYAGDNVCCYLNGDTKPLSASILTEAEALLNTSSNHTLGHSFKFYEPDYNLINIRLTLNCEDTLTETSIKNRLNVLFNGGVNLGMTFPGYRMGETVNEFDLISSIQSVDGVTSCIPELMDTNGEYNRFSSIINQYNEVVYLNNVEVVFRED